MRHSIDNDGWSEVISGRGRRRPYRLDPADTVRGSQLKETRRGPIETAPRTSRLERQRRRRVLKRVAFAVGTLVLVAVAALGVWMYLFLSGVQSQMQKATRTDPKIKRVLSPPPERHEPFTILLMGVDGRPSDPAQHTDTMILARVDPDAKKVWMVSIPRDTRAEIPGYGTRKINAANFLGGPSLAVETVKEFMGVPVNNYMTVNLAGFQKLVDAMGGIYIDVDVEIDDKKAAAASPGHRASHIDPGYQLLDGEHALTYVRSRDFPDADMTRIRHQQTFFKALARQSFRFGNILRLPSMVKHFSRYTSTNMSVSDLIALGRAMRGVSDDDVQTATLTGEWRSPYIYTDEAVKERLVEALKSGGDLETTATPSPSAPRPQEVSVTVRNGAGISGVAGEAAVRLRDIGYVISGIGNADQFVYDETLVVYKTDEAAARAVVGALGKGRAVEGRGMYSFDTDLLVVVGKDWDAPVR